MIKTIPSCAIPKCMNRGIWSMGLDKEYHMCQVHADLLHKLITGDDRGLLSEWASERY